MSLDKQISKARMAYSAAVAAYTVEDMLNGNPQKDAIVEKRLAELDRLERTKAVRAEMAKIRKQFS